MLTEGFFEECERIAIKMRRELKLWAYDPLPAHILAEHMKIRLLAPGDLGMSQYDVEQAMGSTGWSAITVLTKPYTIIFHPHATAIQLESNIMHELAHILWGHRPEQLGIISDSRVARKYSKRQEFEADNLGVCLQLPCVALHYAKQKGIQAEQIAKDYHLNLETVIHRLS